MKQIFKLLLVLSLILTPIAVFADQPHFLDNYDLMRPGSFVNKYYYDKRALFDKSYIVLTVKKIDTCYVKDSWGFNPNEASSQLKNQLMAAAEKNHIERFFDFEENAVPKAVLEIAITEQSSGNPIGRGLFPGLSFGQPYLRIEGRIKDAESNKLIATFSHFKVGRNIWLIRDIGQEGGMLTLRDIYRDAADDIMREIGNTFGFIPEPYKNGSPFKYN